VGSWGLDGDCGSDKWVTEGMGIGVRRRMKMGRLDDVGDVDGRHQTRSAPVMMRAGGRG
jgi:hypothetical protein